METSWTFMVDGKPFATVTAKPQTDPLYLREGPPWDKQYLVAVDDSVTMWGLPVVSELHPTFAQAVYAVEQLHRNLTKLKEAAA